MTAAIHVGPDVYSFGGTQSVIRAIRDNQIGADRIDVLSTWDGPSHARSLRLTAKAAAHIAVAPKGSVVHFHISTGGAWLREGALIRVAHARRLPVVITVHGHDFPEFSEARPRLVRTTLGRAGHVICLSDEAKAIIQSQVPEGRVSVVPNPVTIDDDAPPADAAPPIVLFAGTIARRKGVDTLAEAWELLLAGGIEGECWVVGRPDDYDPPALERLTVKPAVHPDAIPGLLREVRVVALPSHAEGMPMILTEALAGARPFVATPVGGTAGITPDADMLVPVSDAPALADALRRYLVDPKLAREAGERGRQYIRETRSPEVIGARLREIYAGL